MTADRRQGAGFQSDQSDTESNGENCTDIQERLIKAISPESFEEWYYELQFTRNIRNGTPYFNGPSDVRDPERHSPSSLLQCHRKTFYKQLNAPAENDPPEGIFWIGSQFEQEIALPFLRDAVADQDEYVTNSLWVDFNVETESGELRIKGETDPVIVDGDSKPHLVTEIKTKKSVDDIDSPNKHHKAQSHAYMKGLSEKYERNVTDAVIIYGGRTSLNIRSFHITFDPIFWKRTVIDWAAQHTEYRLRDKLPPADPEYDWECTFCPYRERCGKGDLEYNDIGPAGLLPGFAEYPKKKVVEYLEAHEDAKLTPKLVYQYPELLDQYQVYDWQCRVCSRTYSWDSFEWNGNPSNLPRCPGCAGSGPVGVLDIPALNEQPGGENRVDE